MRRRPIIREQELVHESIEEIEFVESIEEVSTNKESYYSIWIFSILLILLYFIISF